jgi:hypothetical protein
MYQSIFHFVHLLIGMNTLNLSSERNTELVHNGFFSFFKLPKNSSRSLKSFTKLYVLFSFFISWLYFINHQMSTGVSLF